MVWSVQDAESTLTVSRIGAASVCDPSTGVSPVPTSRTAQTAIAAVHAGRGGDANIDTASLADQDWIHPSPRGHAYIADRLMESLRQSGITPAA